MTFIPHSLEPTRPIEIRSGKLVSIIYDQEGEIQELLLDDTKQNRQFIVWLRKYDRP
jgi:hypothetical protein